MLQIIYGSTATIPFTDEQLVNLLIKRQAHMSFEDAVKDFPQDHINARPPQVEYTFWHLVEHLRICQWDILDYIRNSDYQMIDWPADYWPARDQETDGGRLERKHQTISG